MHDVVELSLSPDYVSDWGLTEAVREILQNAIDCQTAGADVNVVYQDRTLSIATRGASILDRSTLRLGASDKGDPSFIGKYGEGYKLAMLVLTRLRKPLRIYTGSDMWIPVFGQSDIFDGEVLQVLISETATSVDSLNEVIFEIGDITPREMLDFRGEFIALDRFLGRDIGAYRASDYGSILLEKEFQGKFYVNGLYVQTDNEFSYGYDFDSQYVDLDRDRKAINYYELKRLTARSIANSGDVHLLASGIKKSVVDVSETEIVLNELSQENCVNFRDDFFEKNNLAPDTLVCTSSVSQVVSDRPVLEEVSVVARIIARANDEEEYLSSLENQVKSKTNRVVAKEAFNNSDYKRFCKWLRRQTRLSKKAKKEFMDLLDNSLRNFTNHMLLSQEDIEILLAKEEKE